MTIVAYMKPHEQPQRLEVVSVGRNRPRRVLERSLVGTEPLVAQPEDVERVGILADVLEKFFQAADRHAIVLEPECFRRPEFQPRRA